MIRKKRRVVILAVIASGLMLIVLSQIYWREILSGSRYPNGVNIEDCNKRYTIRESNILGVTFVDCQATADSISQVQAWYSQHDIWSIQNIPGYPGWDLGLIRILLYRRNEYVPLSHFFVCQSDNPQLEAFETCILIETTYSIRWRWR